MKDYPELAKLYLDLNNRILYDGNNSSEITRSKANKNMTSSQVETIKNPREINLTSFSNPFQSTYDEACNQNSEIFPIKLAKDSQVDNYISPESSHNLTSQLRNSNYLRQNNPFSDEQDQLNGVKVNQIIVNNGSIGSNSLSRSTDSRNDLNRSKSRDIQPETLIKWNLSKSIVRNNNLSNSNTNEKRNDHSLIYYPDPTKSAEKKKKSFGIFAGLGDERNSDSKGINLQNSFVPEEPKNKEEKS